MVSSRKKEYAMRSRLFEHIKQKEIEEHRKISNKDIVEATGVTRNTVATWMSNDPIRRIDADVLLPLADFVGCDWHELIEPIEN